MSGLSARPNQVARDIAADLAWWEEAFGPKSVCGWSFRHTAQVKIGPSTFSVTARDREYFMNPVGLPAYDKAFVQ